MFKKLRNKLIMINLGITSVIILIAFTAIYISATRSADQRPPRIEDNYIYNEEIETIIEEMIREEKQAAASQLLISLIVSGIVIEAIVAFVSYYLAEESIKPVREAYDSQKVFIANASHEIKTPLAAISANLEAADIHGNKWIGNVEKETAKLTALNNELLNLARTDLVTESTTEEVDLKKIVDKLKDSFEPRLTHIQFTYHNTASGKIRLSLADFSQIFSILMDNAIKYSEKKITLKVTNHELIISNDGTTISPKNLPHIFDRFYQVDKSAEGVGLGLSIAKSLADRNHWKLTATSSKVTTFTLSY